MSPPKSKKSSSSPTVLIPSADAQISPTLSSTEGSSRFTPPILSRTACASARTVAPPVTMLVSKGKANRFPISTTTLISASDVPPQIKEILVQPNCSYSQRRCANLSHPLFHRRLFPLHSAHPLPHRLRQRPHRRSSRHDAGVQRKSKTLPHFHHYVDQRQRCPPQIKEILVQPNCSYSQRQCANLSHPLFHRRLFPLHSAHPLPHRLRQRPHRRSSRHDAGVQRKSKSLPHFHHYVDQRQRCPPQIKEILVQPNCSYSQRRCTNLS